MELFQAFDNFPDVARPIIIKSDVVRLGVKFGEKAREIFKENDDILYKGYHLFSYDRDTPVMYGERIPHDFYLEDGTPDGTLIQVRTYSQSPYTIDHNGQDFVLYFDEKPLDPLHFEPRPRFYQRTINGKTMAAYVIGHGDFLFVTANKYCEHFSTDKQCLFCDLTPFARRQKKGEDAMILRKNAEQIAEVLEVALHEHRFRHIFISGGTFLGKYQGLSEIEWYSQFLNTIIKRIKHWYTATFQMGALSDEGWKRIHDTGIPSIQPNIEVWDKRLFEIICPGKAAVVGYDEWIKRTIRAVDFWGPGNVNPNFVSGVEMAKPFGFTDVNEAVDSTLSGYDFLMSNGVLPRQGDFWCIEADSKLAGAEPPPLEYYIKLGKGYLELREKHGFMSCAPFFCRYCGPPHGTEYDFEYWHGNGPSSRKAEIEDMNGDTSSGMEN